MSSKRVKRRRRRSKTRRSQIFYRIAYIVNANGSIQGNQYYCTIEGYFFAFSDKQAWIDKLHRIVDEVARARGIEPDDGREDAPVEEGEPISRVPPESWWVITVGEETQQVEKGDLPSYPFYVATIRVNDREIGKVDLVERDLSLFPLGLRSYFESLLIGIINEVVQWSRDLL